MSAPKKKPSPARKKAPVATVEAPVVDDVKSTPAVEPDASTPEVVAAPVETAIPEVEPAPEVLILEEIKDALFAPATGLQIDTTSVTSEIVIPASVGESEVAVDDEDDLDAAVSTRRGRIRGDAPTGPEHVNMLTPDRILDGPKKREAPESGLRRLVYQVSFGAINLGDSKEVRARKALDLVIGQKLDGGTKFIPVLTRKGGVGKTTVTTMLGMALSLVREDRVVAIDANPDRGTLAERFKRTTDRTIRELVLKAASIRSFSDFSEFVSRDKTRLDVVASDTDPHLSEAFNEQDYNVVAELVARYYSIALTDCGTGIVHSVMKPTLDRAHGLVIVSGGSFDEARLAAETLTWLDANGYKHLVRNSIVALNTATQGTQLVNLAEIESHFRSRVRGIVRIPYDAQLATGSYIDFDKLKPLTREAARELAALVVEGVA